MGQEKNIVTESPSFLIDKIGYIYNLLHDDPIVYNFTEYNFGEKVTLETLSSDLDMNPPDHYRFCVIIGCPIEVFPHASRFQRVLYLTNEEFDQLITRFPILLDAPYYFTRPSLIMDGLFIGQLNHVKKFDLTRLNIQTIVNMTDEALPQFAAHPNYHHFSIRDNCSTDITEILPQVHSILTASPQNALVFCHKGVSRSGSMVLFHTIQSHPLTLDSGLAEIRKFYPRLAPNDGFMRQIGEVLAQQQLELPQDA
jgi:hypothetical protein